MADEEKAPEAAVPVIASKAPTPKALTLTLEPHQWDLIRRLLGQFTNYDQGRPIIEAMEKQLEGPKPPLRAVQGFPPPPGV